jgi:hypothetical protein
MIMTTWRITRGGSAILPLIAGLGLFAAPAQAKGDKVGELYRANAMVPFAVGPGATGSVDIKIGRWSTEEEEQRLRDALRQKGTEGLFNEMKRQKKTGFVAVRGERGYPTYYAQELLEGDQRTILILTDREIEFEEVYNREISLQFPFTMISMTVDGTGNGTGMAILGAELVWDEQQDVLRVTGYSAEPIRLEGIRLIKKK